MTGTVVFAYQHVSSSTLAGIWGTDDKHIWAVGDSGTVLTWNGTAWTTLATPLGGSLAAVWGTSAQDVFIAGSQMYSKSGDAWTAEGGLPASDVRGGGANSLLAAGEMGLVQMRSGTNWLALSGFPTDLKTVKLESLAVSGTASGPEYVLVAGHRSVPSQGVVSYFHKDADAWKQEGAMELSEKLYAAELADTGVPWVAGESGKVLRLDGGVWNSVASGTDLSIFSLKRGIRAGTLWAVGDAGLLLYWDGTKFSGIQSGTTSTLSDVWESPNGEVWLVGIGGTLRRCRLGAAGS